jgi:hypothetical protein
MRYSLGSLSTAEDVTSYTCNSDGRMIHLCIQNFHRVFIIKHLPDMLTGGQY